MILLKLFKENPIKEITQKVLLLTCLESLGKEKKKNTIRKKEVSQKNKFVFNQQ
jgi:hypothetical protein